MVIVMNISRTLNVSTGLSSTSYLYQRVLIKVYYHAGLMELAKACGHRGETLTALQKCSNFKRTHQFLLQVWQAIYWSMIKASMTRNPENFLLIAETL